MTFRTRRPPWLWLALLALSPLPWLDAEREANAEEESVAEPAVRYPFDPVCPWGRVADGRGMLVRCLEPSEAARLATVSASSAPAPRAGAVAAAAPAAAAVPVAAAPASPAPPPAPARTPAAAAAPLPAPVLAPTPTGNKSSRRVLLKEVGPAQADAGELPDARVQLARASDRYVQCVESFGGITQSPAKVTLRFLVRERGRAEGITVKERTGLSVGAAKCVADVVDRRFVGYPAAPIVGADLSIEFVWEGAGR
jgi:hypothetical protein